MSQFRDLVKHAGAIATTGCSLTYVCLGEGKQKESSWSACCDGSSTSQLLIKRIHAASSSSLLKGSVSPCEATATSSAMDIATRNSQSSTLERLSTLVSSTLVNDRLDFLKILHTECPALFRPLSDPLRSRLFFRIEHESAHTLPYSRIDDNVI